MFFEYIKNPTEIQVSKPEFSVLLLLFIGYFLSVLPIGIANGFICKLGHITHFLKKVNHPTITLIIAISLAPVYEEFLFRALLRFNKKNILLFISTIFTMIVVLMYMSKYKPVFVLLIILLCFVFLYLNFKKIKLFINAKFKYFFYFSVFAFGLAHLSNFSGNIYIIMIAFPLLIAPQLILGLILGFIRMKYGLIYSILFHFLVNTPLLISLLKGI